MLLYHEHATLWRHLSPPELYRDEAARWRDALRGCRTVLELGCGAGHLLSHLAPHFQVTAIDLSEPMLELSRQRNPDVEHAQGDMRTLRLGRRFDAVLLHDAAAYLLSHGDVEQALATAACHLEPGGLLLVQPDYVQESFPGDHTAHHAAGPGVDVLEWCRRVGPERLETTYVFLLATETVRDTHVMGLFARQLWLEKLKAAGFRATCSQRGGPHGQGVYWFSGRLMKERGNE